MAYLNIKLIKRWEKILVHEYFILKTIKAVLPDMIESNRGHLVSISSVLGLLGMRGISDYCSSKFAISGLMEALHWEVADHNIHITSVHPYLVDNQMFAGLKLRLKYDLVLQCIYNVLLRVLPSKFKINCLIFMYISRNEQLTWYFVSSEFGSLELACAIFTELFLKNLFNFLYRFPWLVPPLNEGYVAKRTVSAVLTNENSVVMPRIMLLVLWARR